MVVWFCMATVWYVLLRDIYKTFYPALLLRTFHLTLLRFMLTLFAIFHSIFGASNKAEPILKIYVYRISPNSFRGTYSFLNLILCTVTFDHITYRCGNYSREETIQGRKLFAEIRYVDRKAFDIFFNYS